MKNKVRPNKNEGGITLITLIIMIIILVLVSAVAIKGLLGNTGLISSAGVAAEDYKVAQYKEQVTMLRESAIMEHLIKGDELNLQTIADSMEVDATWVKSVTATIGQENQNDDIIVSTTDGYMFQIYYDEKTEQKFIEYVGRGEESSLPKVKATYSTDNANITVSAKAEQGISKIEVIYKGNVETSIDKNKEAEVTENIRVQRTGWYEVKVTASDGYVRYAWIRATSTVVAPNIEVLEEIPDKNGWYGGLADNKTVKVDITTDSVEAVAMYYKILVNGVAQGNGEYERTEDKSIQVDLPQQVGTITVLAYTIDKKENESQEGSLPVKYDNEKPIFGYSIEPEAGKTGWHTSDVTISLATSKDGTEEEEVQKGSGVAGYYYWYQKKDERFDTDKEEGDAGISSFNVINKELKVTTDGDRVFAFKIEDKAGNQSEVATITVKRDTQEPTVSELKYKSHAGTKITVEASGQDITSGVAKYEFQYKGKLDKDWKTGEVVESTETKIDNYVYPENLLEKGETYQLRVAVIDGAGNRKYSDGSDSKTGQGGTVPPVEVLTECAEGEHQWGQWIEDTPAKCTTTGTHHRICSVCSKREDETIAALNHSWGTYTVITSATCYRKGLEQASCTRSGCSETNTRDIAMTSHNLSYITTTEAKCTTSGIKTEKCTNSGCTYTTGNTQTIPALNHSWGSYTVKTSATCYREGSKTAKCTRSGCTATNTLSISKTSHSLSYVETKAATCTTNGTKTEKCTNSGCTYTTGKTQSITALGHKLEYVVTKAATCTSTGQSTEKCTRTGCTYSTGNTKSIPQSHSWVSKTCNATISLKLMAGSSSTCGKCQASGVTVYYIVPASNYCPNGSDISSYVQTPGYSLSKGGVYVQRLV